MTEQQWRASTDARRMLSALPDTVSARQQRLFAAACCRRVWELLTDERSRRAVEVAERHADGLADLQELAAARAAARTAAQARPLWERTLADTAALRARQAAAWAASEWPARAAGAAARAAALAEAAATRLSTRTRLVSAWGTSLANVPPDLAPATWKALSLPAWWVIQAEETEARRTQAVRAATERRHQSNLLREIVGNPFRPSDYDATCLSPACRVIARAVHEDGSFDQLPILADALEEADCRDAELLAHLRSAGPHVRGCWALDVVLQMP